jgi:hypothetical protein
VIACGDSPPPALTVGPISYEEERLLGLTDDRRQTLADLTALGLVVAEGGDMLGTRILDGWEEDRLLEILAADLTLEKNGVGDAVLEARYETDPQWELTVRHVLFFSERWRSATHRSEAEAKAERAMASLQGGADFASTAAELSEEPGARGREGLLTPGREGSWVPEFWAAALALEPGQISPVTETQYGYHILRLEDRRIIPFSEARTVVARDVADRIEDPATVLDTWMATAGATAEARREAALREAELRGLEVPVGEVAALRRAWSVQVEHWSTTLGFRQGMSQAEVAEAALAALSDTSQGTGLARSELAAYRSLLEKLYPIRFADDAD